MKITNMARQWRDILSLVEGQKGRQPGKAKSFEALAKTLKRTEKQARRIYYEAWKRRNIEEYACR